MLELEMNFFEKKLPDLVKSDLGKYILIKGEEIFGTYVAIDDALQAGYQKFKTDAFFIRQILPFQQKLDFANNYHLV